MKSFALACILALAPLTAWAQMTSPVCDDAWDAMASSGLINAAAKGFEITQRDDGWCKIAPNGVALSGVSFDAAQFRLDGLTGDQSQVRTFELQIDEAAFAGNVFAVSAEISQHLDAGLIAINRLSARAEDGSGIILRGTFEMAPFDDLGSVTGAELLSLDAQIFVTPDALSDLRIDLKDVTRASMANALRDVEQSQVSRASRQEFLRFAGATPQARGTLAVTLDAPSGLAISQIVTPLLGLPRSPSDREIAQAVGVALSDLTIQLAWKPGRI
jgi:hypothetical protein